MAKNRDRLQGRWILSRGWISRDLLKQAYAQVDASRGEDLCTVLVKNGLLSKDRALRVRRAVARSSASKLPALQQGTGQNVAVRRGAGSAPNGVGARRATRDDRSRGRDEMPRGTTVKVDMRPETNFVAPAPAPVVVERAGQSHALRDLVTDSDRFRKVVFAQNQQARPSGSDRFRNYLIISELNRGAMGVVYRARDLETDELVALKFMLADNPNHDEQVRFKREVGVLARLEHEHIVRVVDFGCEHGLLFFAMELVEGQNLKDWVDDSFRRTGKPPSWERLGKAFQSVASALSYIHEIGIIHRDIKPQNILIEKGTDRAVLVDFGLIKKDRSKLGESIMSAGQDLTQHGDIIGTPAFMSPEQFAPGGNFGKIGPHSDVWGFGATLYYCVTGRPPYNRATAIEIFREIMAKDVKPVQYRNPELPEWLSTVCNACLIRLSPRRPSMAAVAESLHEATVSLRMGQSLEFLSDSMEYMAEEPGGRGSGRLFAIAIACLMLLVILVAVAAFLLIPKPMDIVRVTAKSKVTQEQTVEISGQLSRGPFPLKVGSRKEWANDEGYFRLNFPLAPGENKIRIEVIDGDKLQVRFLQVFWDTAAPELVVGDGLKAGGLYRLKDDGLLRGRVTDDHKVKSVSAGKLRARLGSNGEFELRLPSIHDEESVELVAQDVVGRKSSLQIKVVPESVLVAREQALKCLESWSQWRGLNIEQQNRAIEAVAERLGVAFRVESPKTFRMADREFRIGRYVHKSSGVMFHLIPGGSFIMGRSLSDKEREDLAALRQGYGDPKEKYESVEQVYMADLYRLHINDLAYKNQQLSDTGFESRLEFLKSLCSKVEFVRKRCAKELSLASSDIDEIIKEVKAEPKRIERLERVVFGAVVRALNQRDRWMRSALRRALGISADEDIGDFVEKIGLDQDLYLKLQGDLGKYIRANKLSQIGLPLQVKQEERLYKKLEKVAERFATLKLYSREEPAHEVKVKPFLISRDEVTVQQWRKFARRAANLKETGDQPVNSVSWRDCQAWFAKAQSGFRFPTEAEWEYACRAGSESAFFWGQEFNKNYLWYRDNSSNQRHSSTRHRNYANAFGLRDVLGNVAEWCQDDYHGDYNGAPSQGEAWLDDKEGKVKKVVRGGAYLSGPSYCRSFSRLGLAADKAYTRVGFRVVVDLPK